MSKICISAAKITIKALVLRLSEYADCQYSGYKVCTRTYLLELHQIPIV